ncbi:MAG: condensation domain-containing protein, partial [Pseudomonadota bacterium]
MTRPTEPIPVADRTRPLRASLAQQRLWFLCGLQGAGRAYHIHSGLRLRGVLRPDALAEALDLIVARHEALRTTFLQRDGTAYQSIHDPMRMALRRDDLEALADPSERLLAIVDEEAREPFDLERGPLIRARLVRVAAEDHLLLVTMHHIVSDAWSMGILTREIGILYHARLQGRENPLPPLRIQYADHAEWQRRRLEGDASQRQLEYWRETLAGAPTTIELPSDRPRPRRQDYRGGSVDVRFDARLGAALKSLARDHGVSLFTVMLAGWGALLSRLSGQRSVLVGSPVANRSRKELEGLIGFFVNMLALRIDLEPATTVSALLRLIGERALRAQQHSDVPFEQVVEALKPPRSLAHSPLFQTILSWQNAPGAQPGLPGLSIEPMGVPNDTAQFDLALSIGETGDRIVGTLSYATALFERDTVLRFLEHWRELLEGMARDPGAPVSSLSLLSPPERERLLTGFNATARAYAGPALVHGLFEAQVRR